MGLEKAEKGDDLIEKVEEELQSPEAEAAENSEAAAAFDAAAAEDGELLGEMKADEEDQDNMP